MKYALLIYEPAPGSHVRCELRIGGAVESRPMVER